MKVVEAENCVLKSRLAAMEKQMEERETQSKENVRMMEEINKKVVDSYHFRTHLSLCSFGLKSILTMLLELHRESGVFV